MDDNVIDPQDYAHEVLDEGIWCEGCGWYEVETIEKDTCPSCGCARTLHVPAKVVRA